MGPNFREPQSSNYSRCKKENDCTIEEFAGSIRLKHNLEETAIDVLLNKKEKVLKKLKTKL